MQETFGEIALISFDFFLRRYRSENTHFRHFQILWFVVSYWHCLLSCLILTQILLGLPGGNEMFTDFYMSWPNSVLSVCLLWWKNPAGAIKNLLRIKNLNSAFKELLKCETYYLVCTDTLQAYRYMESSLEDM